MLWARQHDKCIKCGKNEFRHVGRGLCKYCYQVDSERRDKLHISRRGKYRRRVTPISRDELERQYVQEQMSLVDLARKYNCTRQYIHKLLKHYGIERRDKSGARTIAMSQRKISFKRIDHEGNESEVFLQKITINKNFFKIWSSSMAYVLGVIYTDGNLLPGRERDPLYKNLGSRFSVAQKEPELLEKVLDLMGCNAKLYFSKQTRTGNPIYQFHVNEEEIYDDLLKLGLTPKKSRSIQFPKVPESYVRHFIRGCWDGDGSVYLERNVLPCASFVSGSRQFIYQFVKHLVTLGLPDRTIHTHTNRTSYYFRFTGAANCTELYHVLYEDVPETMYLTRKFDRFKAIAFKFEGQHADEVRLPLKYRIEPLEPIMVQSDGQRAQEILQPPSLQVDHPETTAMHYKRWGTLKGEHFLVIPEPFTRTSLAENLKISPEQVSRVLQSPPLRAEIKKLANNIGTPNVDIRKSIRELKRQAHIFLFGWDDGGWDDLD